MPSQDYKRPKRTKKHHKGRALTFKRQYDYSVKKSAIYQAQVFYTFGAEYGLISSLQAMAITVDKWNELYQDTLTPKHAFLVLCIKHYCTLNKVEKFHSEDIRAFYRLDPIIGFYASVRRSFRALFNDLTYMDFCNPHAWEFKPTTRVKLFATMYQKSLQDLFKNTTE